MSTQPVSSQLPPYSAAFHYPQESDWVEFEQQLPQNYSRNRNDYTPLQVALICRNARACAELLQQLSDPNDQGRVGLSPLQIAFQINSEPLALLLAERGANVNQHQQTSEYEFPVPVWLTPLMQGENFSHFFAYCLREGKIDPNICIGGITVLAWAVILIKPHQISEGILTLFIRAGARFFPCVIDSSILKSTFKALSNELYLSQNVLQLLLIAYEAEHFDVASKQLLFQFLYREAQADDKLHRDDEGRSLLHYALLKKWEWATELMLQDTFFAPTLCRSWSDGGITPLSLAKHGNMQQAIVSKISQLDDGYTERLKKLRRFVNLSGYPDPRLEGEILLYPQERYRFKNPYFKWVLKIFSSYVKSAQCLYKYQEEHIAALNQAINPSDSETAFHDYLEGKVLILPLGVSILGTEEKHMVTVLLCKNILVKVDLSGIEGEHFGIYFYHIESSKTDLFEALKELHILHKLDKPTLDPILQRLKPQLFKWVQKTQPTGNCPAESAKYSLPALSFLLELQAQENYDQAWVEAERAFEEWEEESLIYMAKLLKSILSDAVQSPKLSLDYQIALQDHFIQLCDSKNLQKPVTELFL